MKNVVHRIMLAIIGLGISLVHASSYENTTAKIDTRIGELEFVGGFPTQETIRKAYNQLDVQRATQAYLEFMPMASVNSIFEAHIRDYGWTNSSDIQVYIKPGRGQVLKPSA